MSADREAFMTRFLATLRTGAPRANPFVPVGSMAVHWDGETCRIEADPPTKPGLTSVELTNSSDEDVTVVFGQVTPPKRWSDVVPFLRGADLADPSFVQPDGIAEVPGSVATGPDSITSGVVTLPAGDLGALCLTGTWPEVEWSDAGPFTVGG